MEPPGGEHTRAGLKDAIVLTATAATRAHGLAAPAEQLRRDGLEALDDAELLSLALSQLPPPPPSRRPARRSPGPEACASSSTSPTKP